jgi:hypothetical protein
MWMPQIIGSIAAAAARSDSVGCVLVWREVSRDEAGGLIVLTAASRNAWGHIES